MMFVQFEILKLFLKKAMSAHAGRVCLPSIVVFYCTVTPVQTSPCLIRPYQYDNMVQLLGVCHVL